MSQSFQPARRDFAAYYRLACLDGQAYQQRPLNGAIPVSFQGIVDGVLPKQTHEQMRQLRQDAKKAKLVDEETEPIPIVLQCASYVRAKDRAFQTDSSYPRELCALVAVGHVLPDDRIQIASQAPMIPRELLGPSDGLTLADLDQVDIYLAEHASKFEAATISWAQFTAILVQMRETLLEDRPEQEGYVSVDTVYLSLSVQPKGVVNTIVSAYDRLERLDKQDGTALFDRLVSLQSVVPAPLPSLISTAALRLGQMKSDFPLAAAQRDALSAAMSLQDGQVLALNGPPGTGKTTLLQSVVASRFVQAALHDLPAPLIVGASANNQAVTNILDSFNSGMQQQEGLTTRWLPRAHEGLGFGLFLASKSQEARTPHLTPTQFQELMHSPGLAQTEQFYLGQAGQVYPQIRASDASLSGTLSFLKKELAATVAKLQSWASLFADMTQLDPQACDSLEGLRTWHEKEQQFAQQSNRLDTIVLQWERIVADENWVQTLLARFGPFKRKRQAQVSLFLSQHAAVLRLDQANWEEMGHRIQQAREAVRQQQKACSQGAKLYERWLLETAPYQGAQSASPLTIRQLDELLDMTLRHTAFWLATHIFEARWIQEMSQTVWSGGSKGTGANKGERGVLQSLRLRAMLTPCMVSTFHSLPNHFSYISGREQSGAWVIHSLFNVIDLLIVDEAGQIAPEIAVGSFALAKQALVVGDTQQIEPVWSVPKLVDKANWNQCLWAGRASTEAWSDFAGQGLAASNGSLMQMAQRATAYSLGGDLPAGMYLFEHRRCVEPIIAYCNELCYQGVLIPKRAEQEFERQKLGLPAMGWAYVQGASKKIGHSRSNPVEAKVIARWIKENQSRLEDFYRKPIDEIVGVVTPFKAQMNEVRKACQELTLSSSLTVGTVHALQGAERHIVLFSTVYTLRDGNSYFFDRSPNMLNVAVSRARDSFLVFGDTQILNARTSKPSGILAKHLFRLDTNQVEVDPSWAPRSDLQAEGEGTVIRTLADHRQELRKAFEQAQQELIIVSPWITLDAIEQDDIVARLTQTKDRQLRCKVFYDASLSEGAQTGDTLARDRSMKAVALLEQAGATVYPLHNVHAKEVFVDDRYMLVGSFNWLSASRRGKWVRHEVSIRYEGPQVGQEKELELNALLSLQVKSATSLASPKRQAAEMV